MNGFDQAGGEIGKEINTASIKAVEDQVYGRQMKFFRTL